MKSIVRALSFFAVFLIISGHPGGQEIPRTGGDPFQLGPVLQAARRYCARLEKAALDFVCLEEVSEVLQLRFDNRPGAKYNNTYLYDYQFVRNEGKVKETRALLERNGRKANAKSQRAPMLAFNFADILFAPVQVLDARFEEYYVYRLLGREMLGETEALVLEVAPRLAGVSRYLGGRIWLKADDASVLRIEWDPATFGSYENILTRAGAYGAEPAVRSYTEFGVEKNGLRFPSLDVTEEAYRDAHGKVFVRSRTSVLYRDHKFFTVETQSTIKR